MWFEPQRFAQWARGLYPRDTAKHIAADLGAPLRTVESWLAGTAPGLSWFLQMLYRYEAGFAAALMPQVPRWLSAAQMAQDADALQQQMQALAARQSALQAKITMAKNLHEKAGK